MSLLTRRAALAGTAAVAALAFGPRVVFAQGPAGPFKLDPLPYANNALEPHIDAKTWRSITAATTRPT